MISTLKKIFNLLPTEIDVWIVWVSYFMFGLILIAITYFQIVLTSWFMTDMRLYDIRYIQTVRTSYFWSNWRWRPKSTFGHFEHPNICSKTRPSVLQTKQPLPLQLHARVTPTSILKPHTSSTNKYGIMKTRGRERGGEVWEGNLGAWTAPVRPISKGKRAWTSNRHGVEAPRPQVLAQKDTQGIKLQKKPRDNA